MFWIKSYRPDDGAKGWVHIGCKCDDVDERCCFDSCVEYLNGNIDVCRNITRKPNRLINIAEFMYNGKLPIEIDSTVAAAEYRRDSV